MSFVLGIDLDTTFCSYTSNISGRIDCIEFSDGNKMIPSIVRYDKDIIVGSGALNNPNKNKNICCDSKKYIAKKYNEIDLEYLNNCTYEITNKYGLPYYVLENNEIKSPTEVSSEILKYIYNSSKERV